MKLMLSGPGESTYRAKTVLVTSHVTGDRLVKPKPRICVQLIRVRGRSHIT